MVDAQARQRLRLVREIGPDAAPTFRPKLGNVEHFGDAPSAGGLRIHGAFMPAPGPKLKLGGPDPKADDPSHLRIRGTIVALAESRDRGGSVAPMFSSGVRFACARPRAAFPGPGHGPDRVKGDSDSEAQCESECDSVTTLAKRA